MKEIKISDFKKSSDLEAFRAAVDYMRKNPETRLLLENKTYVFSDKKAIELQTAVMQGELGGDPEKVMFTPQFKYVSGIDFSGVINGEICGNGAKIMIDGFMEPFSVQNCENMTLSGFSIDHVRKPYSKGVVVGFGESYTDVDFKTLSMIYDKMPSPRIIAYSKENACFSNVYYTSEKQLLNAQTLRFLHFSHKTYGDEIYVMNTFHSRPAILIYHAKNTTLSNITIHSQPGMGIVGHESENIYISGLRVIPSDGEQYSVNTDATHFASCRGTLSIENSLFVGHGDDAVNVHTYYHTIMSQKENRCTLRLFAPTYTHSQKSDTFSIGDTVELCNPENLAPCEQYTVVKACSDGRENSLSLDRPLPESSVGMYLANVSALPRFIFRHNTVHNHLARAVLVKTRNVQIEENTISRSTGTAIHIAAEGGWQEGVASENVTVRKNTISDCGAVGHGTIHKTGGICVTIDAPKAFLPAHKNITITDNVIACPQTENSIFVSNTEGLKIENNVCNGKVVVK